MQDSTIDQNLLRNDMSYARSNLEPKLTRVKYAEKCRSCWLSCAWIRISMQDATTDQKKTTKVWHVETPDPNLDQKHNISRIKNAENEMLWWPYWASMLHIYARWNYWPNITEVWHVKSKISTLTKTWPKTLNGRTGGGLLNYLHLWPIVL